MKYRINASITASTGVITANNMFKDEIANGRRFIQMVNSDGGATPRNFYTFSLWNRQRFQKFTAASSVFTFAMALNQMQLEVLPIRPCWI